MLMAAVFSCRAQVKCGIYKACAYFTVSIPGTQMVDEKGNPVPPIPQVERYIYLETRGMSKPVIESVSYSNNIFTAVLSKVEGNAVSAGKKTEDAKEVIIKARNGNALWKLELQPVTDKPQDPSACRNIMIKLKTAGRICSYKVPGGESQLSAPPRY